MTLHDRHAADIDPLTLLDLLRLRVDVFVVEQACAYHELDGRDGEPSTRHIWLSEDGRPLAYVRLLDDGDARRIGRVVTAADRRGEGLAARLMAHVLSTSAAPWVLDAQSHLEAWYEQFGFVTCGAMFVEDGIEHVPMKRAGAGTLVAMTTTDPAADDFVYEEFAYLHENASEYALAWNGPPAVERRRVELPDGRHLSALAWGDISGGDAVVFLHGGSQNAHTWDTVILALGRPAVAIDLPGHGHSAWRDDRAYDPRNIADDVAVAVAELAPDAPAIIGMSLGGLVTNAVAARHPELARRLVVVDVTPGVTADKAKHIHDFVQGPPDFPSFTEIFERTVQFNPTRTAASLRRGIIHNAERQPDGSWRWRYDRRGRDEDSPRLDMAELWDDVEAIDAAVPYLLVRGGAGGTVVDDDDVAQLLQRRPTAQVVMVDGAGHSIQGDRPLELTSLIQGVLDG